MEQQKSILLSRDYRKENKFNVCFFIRELIYSRNFRADPNKNPNELQPHHQCTIHMNSESMSNLQNAYQQALNGKPSQYPLIEMVRYLNIKTFFCKDLLLFRLFPHHLIQH